MGEKTCFQPKIAHFQTATAIVLCRVDQIRALQMKGLLLYRVFMTVILLQNVSYRSQNGNVWWRMSAMRHSVIFSKNDVNPPNLVLIFSATAPICRLTLCDDANCLCMVPNCSADCHLQRAEVKKSIYTLVCGDESFEIDHSCPASFTLAQFFHQKEKSFDPQNLTEKLGFSFFCKLIRNRTFNFTLGKRASVFCGNTQIRPVG